MLWRVLKYNSKLKAGVYSNEMHLKCCVYSAPDSVRTGVNYGSVFPKYG